jgi:hypothetical protein
VSLPNDLVLSLCVMTVVAVAAVVMYDRLTRRGRAAEARPARPVYGLHSPTGPTFDQLADAIHRTLVERVDWPRIDWSDLPTVQQDLRRVVEHLVDCENPLLNRIERERLIDEVLRRIPPLAGPCAPQPEPPPDAVR